jgi:hypothetical protein
MDSLNRLARCLEVRLSRRTVQKIEWEVAFPIRLEKVERSGMLSYPIACESSTRAVIMLLCWRGCFDHIGYLEAVIIRFDQRTDETVRPYADHVPRLREIPGV